MALPSPYLRAEQEISPHWRRSSPRPNTRKPSASSLPASLRPSIWRPKNGSSIASSPSQAMATSCPRTTFPRAAVALAESCFAASAAEPGNGAAALGATVTLDSSDPAEFALFSEGGARAVVSTPASRLAAVQATARQYRVAAREIGNVIRNGALRIQFVWRWVSYSPLEPLRDSWANSLERALTAK